MNTASSACCSSPNSMFSVKIALERTFSAHIQAPRSKYSFSHWQSWPNFNLGCYGAGAGRAVGAAGLSGDGAYIRLLLLLGWGPASVFPPWPSSTTPPQLAAAYICRRGAPAGFPGHLLSEEPPSPGFSWSLGAGALQATDPIPWLHAPMLGKPSSSCSSLRLPLLLPH